MARLGSYPGMIVVKAFKPKISAFISADYFYYPSLDYIAKSNY